MEKKYTHLLIRSDEDGNPVRFLTGEELEHLLKEPDYYGISRFIAREEFEGDKWDTFSNSDTWFKDPAYWKHDVAMLVKLEILEPKPKTEVTEWKIE